MNAWPAGPHSFGMDYSNGRSRKSFRRSTTSSHAGENWKGIWQYWGFKTAAATVAYLPGKAGYSLACSLADIIWMLSPGLRATIAGNLRHVLGPGASNATLKRTVREVLRNAAMNYFDLIKLPQMTLGEVGSAIEVHGWDNFEAGLKRGKGVILATAHLSGFNVAAQIFAVRSIKVTVVVEPLNPPRLLRYVRALRGRHGVAFVPAEPGVLESLLDSLRRGEAVSFTCDRNFEKSGATSVFFGEETALPTVAVRLAMRTGAAVVPIFNWRQSDGRVHVHFEPAISVRTNGKEALASNMQQVTRVMEKYIGSHPEQWVVLSPIWTVHE